MEDHEQLSLTTEWVDLTDEEKVERGRRLAHLLREADLLAEEHAERKQEMKDDRVSLQAQIAELATIVRLGREERPIGRRPRQLGEGPVIDRQEGEGSGQ